jgi:very-short-patch-repair endonuclease
MTKEKCRFCEVEFRIKTPERRQRAILNHLSTHHKEVDQLRFLIDFENFEIPKCRFCGENRKKKDGNNLKFSTTCSRINCIKKTKIPNNETRKKISEGRKKFLRENYQGSPSFYGLNLRKSHQEKLIELELEKREIKGWISQYRNGTYTYDIAFPELKVDIEIDGGQHSTDSGIKRDRHRDEWSISQGWRVLRIKASVIRYNVELAIEEILKFIGPENLETRKNFNIDEFLKKKREEDLKLKTEKREKRALNKITRIKSWNKETSNKRRPQKFFTERMIEDYKIKIMNSDINFSKFGWASKVSKILEISPQRVSSWMVRNLPEFYEKNCFKRK